VHQEKFREAKAYNKPGKNQHIAKPQAVSVSSPSKSEPENREYGERDKAIEKRYDIYNAIKGTVIVSVLIHIINPIGKGIDYYTDYTQKKRQSGEEVYNFIIPRIHGQNSLIKGIDCA
jgi:hypothetical protein